MTTETLALVVLTVLLAVLLGWRLGAGSFRKNAGRQSRQRNRTAGQGEEAAERLLEQEGYEIIDRQVPAIWWVEVDGEQIELEVRADFLVSRKSDDRKYVAEVKTGTKAPDPKFPATRRQLLEYAHVFHPHGVLLVEPDQRKILEVRFPGTKSTGGS